MTYGIEGDDLVLMVGGLRIYLPLEIAEPMAREICNIAHVRYVTRDRARPENDLDAVIRASHLRNDEGMYD